MPNWKLVITSGSDASLNSLNVTTSVTASSFTGSFTGDGSGLTGLASSTLNSSQIYVGNASNVATGVTMSGDVAITNTGLTTVQSGSITYPKLQNTTQASLLGNPLLGGGQVEEIPLIDTFISTSSLQSGLLDSGSNWDINGSYIGTAISGTFQGQSHYNDNYFYTAIQDNFWIRLIRG